MRAELDRSQLRAMLAFGLTRIFYVTAFVHVPTERPVGLVVPTDGQVSLLVPGLEEEHPRARVSDLGPLALRPEYPGEQHPMLFLEHLLQDLRLDNGPQAADNDGYGDYMGYRGPWLSSVTERSVRLLPQLVDDLRLVKSPAEFDQATTALARPRQP